MYQLVKFNEQKWGVRIGNAYIQPKYKTRLFRTPKIVGKQDEWRISEYVIKYCTMPEADARELCSILNKEIQDVLDKDALVNGATVVACDNPVGANSGSN